MDNGEYQENDTHISKVLKDNGFELLRLKTGTPARIYRDSINFDVCEEQPGDSPHDWFALGDKKTHTIQNVLLLIQTKKRMK